MFGAFFILVDTASTQQTGVRIACHDSARSALAPAIVDAVDSKDQTTLSCDPL